MSYNRVIIMGRLTKELEVRYTPAGTAVCDLSVVVSEKYKTQDGEQREEVCFVNVTYFGKIAETIGQYFNKGDGILIEGKLKLDQWQKDGKKYSRLKVTGERFSFPMGKSRAERASEPAVAGNYEPEDTGTDNLPF